MMLKSFEEEQQEMEINMYKYILEGKQHSFPFGYWVETGAKETFKKFLLYYIHEVLGYPKDEIPYHLISKNLIVEAKLISPYKNLFNNRNENLFREMFPEAYPYKMPFITTDLWEGTGEYSGCEPLRDLFIISSNLFTVIPRFLTFLHIELIIWYHFFAHFTIILNIQFYIFFSFAKPAYMILLPTESNSTVTW